MRSRVMSLLPPPAANLCSLCEVRAAQKRLHELGDLARIRRAVRVDHGYDVTGRSFEPAGKRVPLSPASLLHYPDVGPQLAGYRYRVVHRVPVHHDHLVDVRRAAVRKRTAGFLLHLMSERPLIRVAKVDSSWPETPCPPHEFQ